MSLDSHRRETELFDRALDLDAGEQRAFLERECAGDREIAERILRLLAQDRQCTSSLDRPALERLSPQAASARLPERIGPYRILGLLGAGGMGIVYRAEQQSPRREVALKVIRGSMASVEVVRRFAKEANVLARLDHQGIARVFDAGVFESAKGPEPFVAMELVAGEPLLTHVERLRLSRTERVELLARICDAVAHAHDQGIVHRDLKPSNVLVRADGQPKVLDFGVALIVHRETDASTRQTAVGELIGTLPYMSPEQLGDDPTRVDERSDVYALGVIAYELLAGRLPHDLAGFSVPAAARIVTERSPTRLGELDRTLRGDLETIVGKALEKEHAQRYASVRELASDLRRFLRHEPVRAVPPSNLYYLRRFARRNPALTTSLALAALFLIAGSAISIWQARRADDGARKALHAAESSTLAAARIAAEHADLTTSRRLLASIDPEKRGWVWNWLHAKDDRRIARFTTDATTRAATFLADSNGILTVDEAGTVRRWAPGEEADLAKLDLGVRLSGPAAFEREGAFVAGVHGENQETLTLWDASNGRRVAEIPIAGARPVVLAVAPGGKYVAHGGREALLWDTSGQETTSLLPPLMGATAFDFATDGRRLACASNPANDGPGYFSVVDFGVSPFARKSWHRAADEATSIALGQDGRLAVAYRNKRAYVFDPDHERIATELAGSQGPIRAIAFDRTEARLATGTDYGSVCLWNSLDGKELAVFGGASGPVTQVAFSADGSRILSVSGRETSVWDLSSDPNVLRAHASYVYDLAFVRGGRRLVSLSFDGELCAWDAASLELLRKTQVPGSPGAAYGLSAARDGDLLAVASGEVAMILDGDSLALLRTIELGVPGELRDLSLSPDGRRLAGATGSDVLLWDVESGAPLHRESIGLATFYPAVVFSHDGRRFAYSEGNQAVVRDAATGELVTRLEGHRAPVEALAFSPDDTLLASGSVDRTVRLWDARVWKPRAVLDGHTDRVYSLAFSPDGQMLASGSNDATIRLWNVALGEELALLTGHEDYVFALAFDPDGSRLASASGDKTVRLWDTLPCSQRWRAGERARSRREAVRSDTAEKLSAAGDLAAAVSALRKDAAMPADEREARVQALLKLAPGK